MLRASESDADQTYELLLLPALAPALSVLIPCQDSSSKGAASPTRTPAASAFRAAPSLLHVPSPFLPSRSRLSTHTQPFSAAASACILFPLSLSAYAL